MSRKVMISQNLHIPKDQIMNSREKFTIKLLNRNCGKNILVFVLGMIVLCTFLVLNDVYGTTCDETMFIDVPFVPTQHELLSLYDNWIAKHHVNYTDNADEKERRFEIFRDNLWFILEHNSNSSVTYKLGLNKFANLTNDEYRSMFVGGGERVVRDNNQVVKSDDRFKYGNVVADQLPESIDWRDRGAVAPIKDQGKNSSGGSCWAFSTVGAVEGINHIVTGQLITLSEQELFDCHKGFNQGCSSGGCRMDSVFEYIVENGGIHVADDYPYKGIPGQCDYKQVYNPKVVTIGGFENVPQNDENSLKKAVAHQPVSVSIEAGGRAFQLYESGIFNGLCGTELDHGVLAVGYGKEHGKDYWIVRNSWGTSWGENGYMRLERNVASTDTGKCGIAMQPSYPTKKSNSVCDDFFSCRGETTCCCVYELGNRCYGWGCCPTESATCCDDSSSCCPQKFPVCDTKTRTCLLSKDSPIGIKALKLMPAKPKWNLIKASRKFIGP